MCRPHLNANVCPAQLPSVSHHCTEMSPGELEFSSCLLHGISLFLVTRAGTSPPLFMYLCPPIARGQLGLCARWRTEQEEEWRQIYSQWETGPHAHDGDTAVHRLPGHNAWAEGTSGAANNSQASPTADFTPTPWFNYTPAYNRTLVFS